MARLSIPTKARLPPSLRVDPSNPALGKSLGRLSRESLVSLALDWLDERSLANAMPYLRRRRVAARDEEDDDDDDDEDPDDLYPACRSVDELRALYLGMQGQKGAKREVVSRILEGDWRHGLTLYQLAMVDFHYFDEHPMSQRWTAYSILPLKHPSMNADDEVLAADKESLAIPRFHPSTFLQNLQQQVLPDIKAHYHFYRPNEYPVLLLRIFVVESPYNTSRALSGPNGGAGAAATTTFNSSRTVYLAFPDSSPSLFITKSQATGPTSVGESKSLHGLIVSGVPKALSRSRDRFTLKVTNLTSKNLGALLDRKGGGRRNAAGGGWTIYADERAKNSPLDTVLPDPPFSKTASSSSSQPDAGQKRPRPLTESQRQSKRARLVAQARFGHAGIVTDDKGVERVDILMQDPFPTSGSAQPNSGGDGGGDDDQEAPGSEQLPDRRRSKLEAVLRKAQAEVEDVADEPDASRWTPAVRLSFQGAHVFAGVRQLVEAGIVDGERMPGWMTGEEGVTTGVVRHGRIRGHRGSGL
ncbi:hypothetical protein CDD83_9717 [Cordyceps sp. RAO-2017]|nr:hypothetical protein CDD83_9717 [Cordyceps sp. RAO-2017]